MAACLSSPGSADTYIAAAAVLPCLGKDALPPLLMALTNQLAPNRNCVAEAIGRMAYLGTNVSPAVPALIACLRDKRPSVATEVAWSLGKLGLEPQIAVPALINSLQDRDIWLRCASAKALGDFGERARPALPALIEALCDMDAEVRQNATNAIMEIAPAALGKEH